MSADASIGCTARDPHPGLTARSTTALRTVQQMPYRIDIAGGWLDQPFVSRYHPGSVITVSLEPTVGFNERSGMATITWRTAIQLWGNKMPVDRFDKVAVIFVAERPLPDSGASCRAAVAGVEYRCM